MTPQRGAVISVTSEARCHLATADANAGILRCSQNDNLRRGEGDSSLRSDGEDGVCAGYGTRLVAVTKPSWWMDSQVCW